MSSSRESGCKGTDTFEVGLRELERVLGVVVVLLLAGGALKILDDVDELVLVNLDERLVLVDVAAPLRLGLNDARRVLARLVVLVPEADALLEPNLELHLS